ncbi:MAG: histidinol-phosphate transaminase, partial [Nitrospinae bacterium]|nr:histidinol-phosphate transaminase [Nitrospinota bacterium]
EFRRLGLDYIPTEANFILVRVENGREIYNKLLKKGVIVRAMDGYKLQNYIRVTIGLPDENERFIEALTEIYR